MDGLCWNIFEHKDEPNVGWGDNSNKTRFFTPNVETPQEKKLSGTCYEPAWWGWSIKLIYIFFIRLSWCALLIFYYFLNFCIVFCVALIFFTGFAVFWKGYMSFYVIVGGLFVSPLFKLDCSQNDWHTCIFFLSIQGNRNKMMFIHFT